MSDSDSFSITELESRISERSEILEDIHLRAAIDAQLTNLPHETIGSSRIGSLATQVTVEDAIFNDYVNPSSVRNCLSPFTPSPSDRIKAFINDAQLTSSDILLDIGCGDGRVCIAVAKSVGCRSIGIDVSPPCIDLARAIAEEENLRSCRCLFLEMDATIDPDVLLSESSPVARPLKSATVVFLYVYPDLLVRLLPLLTRLTTGNGAATRLIATITYHMSDRNAVAELVDSVHDIKLYSKVVL